MLSPVDISGIPLRADVRLLHLGILQLGDDVFMYRYLSGRGGELTRFSLGPDTPGQPSVNADSTVTPGVQVQDSAQASPVRDAGPPVRTDIAPSPAVQLQAQTYRAAEFVEKGPENPADAGQGTGREGKGDATEEDGPKTKTALSVTARVSMAETITGRFATLGFKSYKDFDEVRTAEGRRRMVCEYESLDRLVKEPTVDILIIDEARAVWQDYFPYRSPRTD
eukprot:g10113.t1